MIDHFVRSRLRQFFCLLACLALGACLTPSAIIVSFDVDLEVRSIGPDGVLWTSAPDAISKTVRKPVELDPFGEAVFRAPQYTLTIGVSGRAFGIGLTNTSANEICFRFDEARLSSKFQMAGVPLRSWSHLRGEDLLRMTRQDRENRKAAGRQPMTKACVGPGQGRTVYVFMDPNEVFPSGILFNAAHPQHTPKLTSDGIGNWVMLHLPVETAGRRENLELTITARRSHLRASYY